MSGSLEGTQRVGRNKHLYAKLEHRGAQWFLCVHVLMYFQFFTEKNGEVLAIPGLSDAEQEEWIDRFIRTGENLFSYKWSLTHAMKWMTDLSGPVLVDVEVVVIDVGESDPQTWPSGGEHVFNVYVIKGGKHVEVTLGDKAWPQVKVTQDSLELLRHVAVGPGGGSQPKQVAALHELGHALGLSHPNCVGNELYCYGDDQKDGRSVMGLGMSVLESDYRVFAEILDQLKPELAPWTVARDVFQLEHARPVAWQRIPGLHTGAAPGVTGHETTHRKSAHRRKPR